MSKHPASSALICEPRFGTPRNYDRPTLGPRVAEAAKALGVPLQPWQQHVADVALEQDPETRQLVYREVDLAVPRQAGKTTLALAAMITRCTRFGPRQNVVYTAQTRKAAVTKWRDQHLPMLEGSPFRASFDVRRANGAEAVLWRNGSIYGLDAPTETSGHGLTLDLALIDEAWAFTDDAQEQSLAPTMITRPSAQLWIMSTAGNARSRFWHDKVLAGRSTVGSSGSVAFFEWSAPEDADPADPAVWWASHPSLGHTIDEAAVRAEYDRASRGDLDLFRRAYLNQWPEIPPSEQQIETVVPLEWWDACCDETSRIVGTRTFAVDVAPDRSTFAIVVVGKSATGSTHVEVVEHAQGQGADRLIARLRQLAGKYETRFVAAHLGGPASSLEQALRSSFGDKFRAVTDKELLAGCGGFYDAIRATELTHVGEPGIRAALEGAVKSHSGDQWRWNRRGSHVDISPLVAATIGWHIETTAPPPRADGWLVWE